jgi:hypothetical protein
MGTRWKNAVLVKTQLGVKEARRQADSKMRRLVRPP